MAIAANLKRSTCESCDRALKEWRRQARFTESDDFVFVIRTNTPIDLHNAAPRHLKPGCRQLGIPEVSWHGLRHTYTTWGRKAGLNAEAMRDLPGHESVKTTLDIYSPANDQGAAAMAIEDHALGGKLLPLSVTPLAGDQELTHGKQWWARGDSNSGPPACEAGALTN